jgi:beta-phosphoglucomutase family hydrolase
MSAVRDKDILQSHDLDAVIFDLDGVITQTAKVHAAAWKTMFDGYLKERAAKEGTPFEPFTDADYRRYVDGKPRYDGVRDFLGSRAITLSYGEPNDPPERETVCGLGNRKNALFLRHLQEHGVEAYPSSLEFVRELGARGLKTALISASKNCREVLAAAGIPDLFETVVDGVVSAKLGLKGKPEPDIFLEAARRLEVNPNRAAVVEDAIAGVQAGARGNFALVVGVDRTHEAAALLENGADIVVADLAELVLDEGGA